MATRQALQAINTQDITDKSRRDLLLLLEAVRGKKNLVIERPLASIIGLFVKFSTLQEYGVDKLFFLENHNVDSSQRNIVFLVRGENVKIVRTVAEQIRLVRSESKIDHDFTVIWVPRRTLVSNLILKEHGVLGEANITDLALQFVPLEPDVLSLELEDCFSDLILRRDPTPIFAAARALMLLQKQYGLFPRILGKGDNAKKLADLLQRMRSEEDVNASSDPNNTYLTSFALTPSATIENLIIIDREVDFPTALATQLTYEGLLDEVFGVSHNQTEVDSSILGGAPAPQPQSHTGGSTAPAAAATKRKVQLDSSDKLYPEIRDANFATIGPLLNRTAKRLQTDQQNIHKADQSISDLKSFVSKLPSYQAESASLKTHTSLAEEITKLTQSGPFRRTLEIEQNLLIGSEGSTTHEQLEELLARATPLPTVLRLLCLESTLSNGLRPRDFEHFKRLLLQAYGYQHLGTLARLERMGLFVAREANRGYLNPISGSAGQTATDWNFVRSRLQLWVDEVEEAEPRDIAFVFSGYAPLSVRLVQAVLQKGYLLNLVNPPRAGAAGAAVGTGANGSGWKGFEDVLARIKGATVDVVQKGSDADASQARKTLRGNKEGPKTSLVFFLGGVTFAEVAALRLVGRQLEAAGRGRKLIIGTTGVISGGRAVDVAIEKGVFGA
ncbi:Vacuolar protein-sorting-associated protein 33 [Friedmanniomyces endolithicus]|uniref:Vacuolar protein-sorting-associated protein 33 n=1 Tax=Friedmanniomyces endolithicus TaxID=329885 RepID=A0AAN6JYJ3_9PEZI|nr:Vacuolar protein-sorting-associated protein 33 [Friedmanniomyces endolithicus]KAK0804644.1 Vacuolar protein-sorting-associated protein 33 [Friedmanniomyces endolithicus]KAK0848016.1 Vacuolar protein-sorting-associated protein 33 [Friedmanniomyces endolithicus]KAK0854329.1 Vacuolar protein-sorting-associated protein 33 [Friedmanniomyces endolithicus]KAK0946790.1 Vacuolar protein-sorting-associated protein 33 [Friedmanniomyces endolithicus]